MAVAGGAFCPPLMGTVADHYGMAIAFLIPLVCFAFIGYYAIYGQKLKSKVYSVPFITPRAQL
jgi:fucose permease